MFNTWYTERLLRDEKKLDKLKVYNVAAVHGKIINMPEEDRYYYEGSKSENSVVFSAGEHTKSELQNVLEKLDYCYGIHQGPYQEESEFRNGKLVSIYIYDCESG